MLEEKTEANKQAREERAEAKVVEEHEKQKAHAERLASEAVVRDLLKNCDCWNSKKGYVMVGDMDKFIKTYRNEMKKLSKYGVEALAACHGPAAACVAAATRPGRSGGLPGPLRRGRVDVTASGYCGDPDQRRRRPARCPPVRARAVPRCVRAVARTEISVLLGARFPLCLASLDRLSQLSTTRAGARVVSATRTLRARREGDA